MRWDDDEQRWIVSTNRGDEMRAHFVAMANGPLHRPKLPGIPGINDFEGHTFHTSRWDYDYTGGDPTAASTGLADKRVGIIGTGATAVQCVPHLGEGAEQLYVFQRTPSSIDVRNNRPTDPEWAASLEPGWQTERMENFNSLVSGMPAAERPRRRRLDRHHRQAARRASSARARTPTSRPRASARADGARRLREDGGDPRARRGDRRRPGDRRGAQALVPPVLQAAVLPRRVPRRPSTGRTSRWSTPTGEGVERITEDGHRGERRRVPSSTASSSPPASRSAPTTRGAPATRSPDGSARP